MLIRKVKLLFFPICFVLFLGLFEVKGMERRELCTVEKISLLQDLEELPWRVVFFDKGAMPAGLVRKTIGWLWSFVSRPSVPMFIFVFRPVIKDQNVYELFVFKTGAPSCRKLGIRVGESIAPSIVESEDIFDNNQNVFWLWVVDNLDAGINVNICLKDANIHLKSKLIGLLDISVGAPEPFWYIGSDSLIKEGEKRAIEIAKRDISLSCVALSR
jgi:hypothetical protein